MPRVRMGDLVTARSRVEAYYSRYAGRPEMWFEPGDIGIVAETGVPSVYRQRTFTVVDFDDEQGNPQRAALFSDNIDKLKPSRKQKGDRIFVITPVSEGDVLHHVAVTRSRLPFAEVYDMDDYRVLGSVTTLRTAKALVKLYGSPRASVI